MEKFNEHHCIKCNYSVYAAIVSYCTHQLEGLILCKQCQKWLKESDPKLTPESKKFYLALRVRGVNVEMEKHDGHKHIDLAITGKGLRLNIEVDGSQHYTNAEQSYSDIQRIYHSFLKGFYTLRLPKILVKERLNETADLVVGLLKHSQEKQVKSYQNQKEKMRLLKQLASISERLEKLN